MWAVLSQVIYYPSALLLCTNNYSTAYLNGYFGKLTLIAHNK